LAARLEGLVMARLMAIPTRDRGDAVLIVTTREGVILMGFVAETTLRPFFEAPPAMCQCIDFVERHLDSFERVLLLKSKKAAYFDDSLACVEVDPADLTGIAFSKTQPN
jgi:hypothetical protein